MTVANELNRIIGGKNTIIASLAEKGVIVPEGTKIDGVSVYVDAIPTGVDISDADVVEAEVLESKTFYATSGGRKTGTMPDNGTVSTDISAKATEVTIAAGRHSGNGIVKIATAEQAKIIPANIKKDVSILGVTGTLDVPTIAPWMPTAGWIDISTVGDNEINLLVTEGTGLAFSIVTSSGTYSIDWGDGTVETGRTSGTVSQHQHTTGGTVCSLGYPTWKVRIYGASGFITRFKVEKHTYNASASQYSPILWAVFGTTRITDYSYAFSKGSAYSVLCRCLQSVTIPSFSYCTTTDYMLQDANGLVNIQLPSSWGAVTSAIYMFYGCTSLPPITLPASWGNILSISGMFQSCEKMIKIILPTSWGNIYDVSSFIRGIVLMYKLVLPTVTNNITNAIYFSASCTNIRFIENLEYLGSDTAQVVYTSLVSGTSIDQPILITRKINKISLLSSPISSVRLTNQESLFEGSSPQISVTTLWLPTAAIETLFGDLPNGLASKAIAITGNPGCDALISKATSGTTAGSTTITISNTASLATGMEVYGTGLSTARAVTMQDAGDTVTLAAHGLSNGMKFMFSSKVSTTGIAINTTYFIVNATTDTFQVSATTGGSALPLTTNGTGNVIVIPTIVTINTNVGIVLDLPASATGSITVTAGILKRSVAMLKGWTVTN